MCGRPRTVRPTADTRSAGTENSRGRGLRGHPRKREAVCQENPVLGCSGSASGGGPLGRWVFPGAPRLLSLFFWGEKLRNFYETPPPPRERVSWALISPPATPQSRWNKKRTKPPNREYPELISWECEGIKGLDQPGSLLRTTVPK